MKTEYKITFNNDDDFYIVGMLESLANEIRNKGIDFVWADGGEFSYKDDLKVKITKYYRDDE